MNTELFELTKEQKRAFARLKKAHKDCIASGICFYNNYGWLNALNKKNFESDCYNDRPVNGILDEGQNYKNELKLQCWEWCDDFHYFHPKKTVD